MRVLCLLLLALLVAACASDAPGGADATQPADTASPGADTDGADVGAEDGREPAADADTTALDGADADAGPFLAASDYCEAAVDAFCPYYLRCGRMAAPDLATCRAVFAESCEARYEPVYQALADLGLLRLSRDGLARCAAHLETVPCQDQLNDLDLGCRGVWVGQRAAGAACGLGIESFVCEPATACVIGLDFCGTCEPAGAAGAPCGDGARCEPTAACLGGACVARGLPGDACGGDGAPPCVVGTACVGGACAGPAFVAVGDACDQTHRCPYFSACVGGTCRQAVRLGEACAATAPCGAGTCDARGVCVADPPPLSACLAR